MQLTSPPAGNHDHKAVDFVQILDIKRHLELISPFLINSLPTSLGVR